MPRRFEEQYHCYSVAYADKAHLEGGDKILLPPSAFDTLARLQVDYPMLFRLQSSEKGTMTHSGVLEFTAEEGSCYIPFWMMQNLLIEEGSVISVTNISLPKATFVKLQPQHVDFLEITNPRAVLEHALRNFSCVTKGDVICIPYNSKNFHFELKEVKPEDAACIIETDCNVDFDAPVGYKEPAKDYGNGKTTASAANANGTNSTNGGPFGSVAGAGGNSGLANLPKQSAYADRSACPSPALSSMSGASGSRLDGSAADAASSSAGGGLKIVDGKIVRPDGSSSASMSTSANEGGETVASGNVKPPADMMAPKTGQTGVQQNSAIAVNAPQIDYWAVNAGDGARLDGKKPAILKDKEGKEVDIRKVRAEAAARRLAATNNQRSMPTAGTMVNGKEATIEDVDSKPPAAPVSKRKSRVGSKYSRLKQGGGFAFGGNANQLKK